MLHPYLNFDGNCRDAFDHYRSVFGGDFLIVQTFRDGPDDMGVPDEEMDNIMHVSFPIREGILMGSDVPSVFGAPPVTGSNVQISVSAESREDADKVFAGLSEGGMVTMPMMDMFWGSYFGSCTDKFGINWMVSVDQPQSEDEAG